MAFLAAFVHSLLHFAFTGLCEESTVGLHGEEEFPSLIGDAHGKGFHIV